MAPESTILIVDDDPSGRQVLEALLDTPEHRLLQAADGPSALTLAAEHRPDVILLDVMMPGMDGFEVCRRLRSTPGLAEIPIFMLTALDDRESRLRGIQAGADEFLSKPYDRLELKMRIQTVTRLNRFRRLNLERKKFGWVAEHARDGFMTVDDDGAIHDANPRARELLGLPGSEAEWIGTEFLEWARRRYRMEPVDAWTDWPLGPAARPDAPACYLVRPEGEPGQGIYLAVDLLHVGDAESTGRLVRLTDVTGEFTRDQDLWRLHSSLNHKLKTPLAGVLGSLEMLVDGGLGLTPEQVRQTARIAWDGAQRLSISVEGILRLLDSPVAATADGGLSVSDLPGIVDEIGQNLGLDSVAFGCQPDATDRRLRLTASATELILRELLQNARQHHPRHAPQVGVEVIGAGSDLVVVRVQDDGRNLPPEHLSRVWQPFYQAERFHTGQAEGMGLGLAMVGSLLWKAGGTCRMSNRSDGPGVIVDLVIPAERKAA